MISAPGGPVRAGHDVQDRGFRFLNGNFLEKVSGDSTAGKLAVFDSERTVRGGPPAHFHPDQDEWFHVIEGIFDIAVDGVEHRLGPGDSILGPTGLTHAFTNVTEHGRLLLVFAPAGKMEAFFRLISELGDVSPDSFAKISMDHGMVVTGPPLAIRQN